MKFTSTAVSRGGPRRTFTAILAAAALSLGAGACGGDDESGAAEGGAAEGGAAQTDAGQTAIDSPAAAIADAFTGAWEAGDWDTALQLSNDSVVATAQEFHSENIDVELVGPVGAAGEMLLTDPAGGSAMVFSFTVVEAGGMNTLETLTFGGDAG